MKITTLFAVLLTLSVLFAGSPQTAQAASGFGGAAQFNCGNSEGEVAGTGAARVSAGGSTIYAGYQQVSGNNQNPIVRSFGANTWCRTDYETSSDDGRAYGIWWDGSTLYVVFSATGSGTGGTNYSAWTGGGWLNSYGAGGGPKVAIVLQLNPGDGAPIGGSYVSARLTNGNTNSATVTSMQYTGSSLLLGIDSAFSPRNTDGSKMDCTQYPLSWTLELSANLSTAIGSAASNCTSISPPPSQVIASGGGLVIGGRINDGRLNAADLAAPVAIYCNSAGIVLYTINPFNSVGALALTITPAQITTGVTQMRSTGQYATVATNGRDTLYALTSEQLQVNSFAPDGTLYEFIFPLTACDSVFANNATLTTSSTTTTTTATQQVTGGTVHLVAQGETLYRIALRYGTTYQTLAQLNGIAPPYTIYVGDLLIIP